MNSKQTVLIAGISGTLGNKIEDAILNKGEIQVRGREHYNSSKLDDLKAKGVEFVEGDLFDSSSLKQACENPLRLFRGLFQAESR